MAPMTLGNPLPVQSARRSPRQPEAEENPTRHKIVIGDARPFGLLWPLQGHPHQDGDHPLLRNYRL